MMNPSVDVMQLVVQAIGGAGNWWCRDWWPQRFWNGMVLLLCWFSQSFEDAMDQFVLLPFQAMIWHPIEDIIHASWELCLNQCTEGREWEKMVHVIGILMMGSAISLHKWFSKGVSTFKVFMTPLWFALWKYCEPPGLFWESRAVFGLNFYHRTHLHNMGSCSWVWAWAQCIVGMSAVLTSLTSTHREEQTNGWHRAEVIRLEQDIFTALAGQVKLYVYKTNRFWSQIKSAGWGDISLSLSSSPTFPSSSIAPDCQSLLHCHMPTAQYKTWPN